MKISVIIPTVNRCMSLRQTLESMRIQILDEDEYEIIVINNGSTDQTEEICKEAKGWFKNFIYLYDENPGLHVGRNLGYQTARSDILVFADDDIIVTDHWLSSILDGFERTDAKLIGGDIEPFFEVDPPEWLNELWHDAPNGARILSNYSCILFKTGGGEREISPTQIYGCNYAIKKEVLDETKGFPPDGVPAKYWAFRGEGESGVSSYAEKQGYKAMYIPGASVQHRVGKNRMSKEYLYGVSFRNGIGRMSTYLRYNSLFKGLLRLGKEELLLYKKNPRGEFRTKKKYLIKGMAKLLYKYAFNSGVRKWIHQEHYLNEKGYIANYLR